MSSLTLNTEFLKKIPGILKLCQLVLGMICMALAAHYSAINYVITMNRSECFFLTTAVTYFMITLLIILSSLMSVNTESRLRQTLFEPMYHAIGCILYFSGSVAILADHRSNVGWPARSDGFTAAGGIGIVTCILYGVSAYDSYRAYSME